jgi:hypothetical protein
VIAILIPTRGLVFTEVENAIEAIRNNSWMKMKIIRSNNKPIPEAHNWLVEEALKDPEVSRIWFIEEDTIPPLEALTKLFYATEDIAFVDYSVNGWSCSAQNSESDILWAGLGCTMIKRQVFSKVAKPWFRTDKTLRFNDWTWIDNPSKYGGQDIWFFTKAREAGFKIKQIEGECVHLKLNSLGTKETNRGLHDITVREKIEKQQIIGTA